MIKNFTYCFIMFLLSSGLTYAQSTGSVSGAVSTSDGNPAELVSILLKGTGKTSFTDKNGNYQIRNIKPGSYTLIASSVGLQKQEQTIEIKAGETATATFTLKENLAELQEVIISSRNPNKVNTEVAKMPLKNLENPQVYNSVSKEILKQQVVTSYDDAFRNVPGITRTWESTGRAGDGGSYFALRGFDAQPSLTNGLPGLTSGNLDPASVEEIQVIKGPSGTLFGASFYGYGGIINTITKKPYHDFGGEVAYNLGSYGLNRVTLDLNTPLSKSKKIAMRINTAYHTENTFQDAGFKKSFYIAPTFVYEVNDRLSFHLLTEILEEKRAAAPVFFNSDRMSPLDFHNIAELNLNNKLSFTSDDLTIKNPRYNLQAQGLYKISDQWNSQTVVSGGRVKSDGIYSYIWDDFAGDNFFDQYFHIENQTTTTIDIQQNFNGDFKIGGLRNRLLIGLDFFHRNVKENSSGWASGRQVTPQGEIAGYEIKDEETGETISVIPPVELTRSAIDNLLAGQEGYMANISNSAYSAYASDVLNITPNFMAMLSLRADYFDSKGEKDDPDDDFNQFALSPKLGLLYQIIPDQVSVFANYMNAFINVEPSVELDENNVAIGVKSFKPEHANQWEFGAKTNLFSNKLAATISYYDIRVSDRVIYPMTGSPIQGGKVGSKGFEIDLNANPLPGLNLIAGYSYNSIKVINGNPFDPVDFYNENGSSPGGQGPQNLANFWATYKFEYGRLKNFGIGAGGNYASSYKVIDNSVTGVFLLPSYALLNGSLFYNGAKFRVNFNVNNITDKQYYTGYWSVNPQRQRNFAASVAYKF